MHRFYYPSLAILSDKIILSDKELIHRIVRVSRIKIGEEVIVFDDKQNEYLCRAQELNDSQVKLEIKAKLKEIKKTFCLTVACAIPKNLKMDDIVDKLTQLGIDRIIPLKTERVVVKLDKHKEALRVERWRKITRSASIQSHRNKMPVVEPIRTLAVLLSESDQFDLKLIPTLTGSRRKLKDCLEQVSVKNILVLIGPEGDFSDEEVGLAIKAGCVPVTLGDLVLRVDTAAIAVAAILNYELSSLRTQ